MSCDRFESLVLADDDLAWSESDYANYVDHLSHCPSGRHTVTWLEEFCGLPRNAFTIGSPEHGLPALDESVQRILEKKTAQERAREPKLLTSFRGRKNAAPIVLLIAFPLALVATTWTCNQYLQAHRVRSILQSHHLAVMPRELEGVDPIGTAFFLTAELRQLKNDLITRSARTPLGQICIHIDDGNLPLARLEADEHLERASRGQLPFLDGFLCREAGLFESQDVPGTPQQDEALVFFARQFRARPDITPEDSEFSRGSRERLVRSLTLRRSLLERCHALTALSGCGTIDELHLLASIVAEQSRPPEERRLAAVAAESILRRSHRCETVARANLLVAQQLLEDVVSMPSGVAWPNHEVVARDLVRAIACVARKQGALDTFRTFTSEKILPRLPLGPADPGSTIVLAALRHPLAAQGLTTLIEAISPSTQSIVLLRVAQAAALFGDDTLTERARAKCTEPRMAEDFSAGLAAAMGELDGKRSDLDSGAKLPAEHKISVGLDPSVPEGTIARWNFQGDKDHDVLTGGSGVPPALHDRVSALAVYQGTDSGDDAKIRIARPGRSEVSLTFMVKDHQSHELVLSHLRRANRAWAFDGDARIEILLDGSQVAEISVPNESFQEFAVPLDINKLELGKYHTVVIRLSPLATTSYTLRWAEIRT